MTIVLFVIGLVLLIIGGEILVRGASQLATAFGLSPLVVGLTVVAFSTSAPELAVSLQAAFSGQADIALGNVVGSNIANVLLILGLSALVAPLIVSQQLIRIDVPIMIGASILLLVLAWDGALNQLEGVLLVALLVGYVAFAVRLSRRESQAIQQEYEQEYGSAQKTRPHWPRNLLLVIVGVALLVVGAQWLVNGAVELARWLGLNELIIGLTIVAAGTSLPELATSIIATYRGERDIAVGNVIGSNIFNIFSVLGLTALIAPNGIPIAPALLTFDLPILLTVAIACLPIFFHGNQIARWEGALFFGYYLAYLAYLVLNATQHSTLPFFNAVMLWFVIPLTAITLVIIVIREVRARQLSA